MKKLPILSLAIILAATSASAYGFLKNNGDGTFFGNCNDNSKAFSGVGPDSSGYYTVSGPNGSHFSQSINTAINLACGD